MDDLDEVARRLGLEVASGGRLRPDGRRLSFRLAGVEVARQRPWLPFFVAWDHAAMRPSPQEVSHRLEVQDLSWLEVSGDPTELEWWLGGSRLPVRFVPTGGAPLGVSRVGISTSDGELVLDEYGRATGPD